MQAVIFCGIQASGKSSFYKALFFDTHVRISLDLLGTRHREQLFLQACLKTGQRFVVDKTNVTIERRHSYIQLAKAAKYEVVGYYFETDLASALQRNTGRSGKAVIPERGIRGTFRLLQPPSLGEGFDRLYTVHLLAGGQFEVLPHPPATIPSS
ncbi:AAA family ATPase [Pontibacter liquoris]|uniref:AAA family ATPase n=1 Tax=Pontibacter liquoris TaxID=2905677 RepID=UPI001FA80FF1|nr:AAA family ATPase [Pontibacter liquoris]